MYIQYVCYTTYSRGTQSTHIWYSHVVYYIACTYTTVNVLPESVYVVLNTFPRDNKYYNIQTHNSMTAIIRLLFF